MTFIDQVLEKLKRHPKRIVFPEGGEERIIRAAVSLARKRVVAPILLGKREVVEAKAEAMGLDHGQLMVIDPVKADDFSMFCQYLEKMGRYRRMGVANSAEIMANPNYFASMMVQLNQADGLVGGASVYSSALLRPLFQLIKPLPGVRSVSGAEIVELPDSGFGDGGVLFFADCGVIPEPTVEQLAGISIGTAKLARQMSGERPRVAMLSFSTKGSAKTPATEKIVAATALARQRAVEEGLDLEIDGELQADTALVPALAATKAPGSRVAGRANVLIFPDLNSGNIASKLVKLLAGARIYGQLMLGLSKPAGEVSRGASVEEIEGVAAIVGLQAVEYRHLYPLQEANSQTG